MISLIVLFWLYVALFGIIGGIRGWAKELLVSVSVILAIFFLTVLEVFAPDLREILTMGKSIGLFWLRVMVLLVLVLFGYQTPNIQRLAQNNRFVRERLQDVLLGIFIGLVNGYLVVGSIWSFLDSANYPFHKIVTEPTGDLGALVDIYVKFLPPAFLGSPEIYFAVAVAFAFVLVVFI